MLSPSTIVRRSLRKLQVRPYDYLTMEACYDRG